MQNLDTTSQAWLKHCAYRYIWSKRFEVTPLTRGNQGGKIEITWSQWFEKKFNEPLSQYHFKLAREQRYGQQQSRE